MLQNNVEFSNIQCLCANVFLSVLSVMNKWCHFVTLDNLNPTVISMMLELASSLMQICNLDAHQRPL